MGNCVYLSCMRCCSGETVHIWGFFEALPPVIHASGSRKPMQTELLLEQVDANANGRVEPTL